MYRPFNYEPQNNIHKTKHLHPSQLQEPSYFIQYSKFPCSKKMTENKVISQLQMRHILSSAHSGTRECSLKNFTSRTRAMCHDLFGRLVKFCLAKTIRYRWVLARKNSNNSRQSAPHHRRQELLPCLFWFWFKNRHLYKKVKLKCKEGTET